MSLGPVELLVIKFPDVRVKGEVATALRDLVVSDTIRIIDLLLVRKDADGNVTLREINELDDEDYVVMDPIVSDISGLLSRDDVEQLADLLDNGSTAGVMLFEDTWATHFQDAVLRAHGQVLYSERIPHAVIEEAAALSAQPTA